MVRIAIVLTALLSLTWPGGALAQSGEDTGCGEVPAAPACIAPAEATKPFTSVEAADACQQAVRNYRDAIDLHVQCRTERTNGIVETANEAIGRFNCRAEARTDCEETSQ